MLSSLRTNLRTLLFGIPPIDARPDLRSFRATTTEKQICLETVSKVFIHTYLIALSTADIKRVTEECNLTAAALRGFAYEGAAAGLAVVDLLGTGGPKLFREFGDGPGARYRFPVHMVAGAP
jgi:hypothetical protein